MELMNPTRNLTEGRYEIAGLHDDFVQHSFDRIEELVSKTNELERAEFHLRR